LNRVGQNFAVLQIDNALAAGALAFVGSRPNR